MQTKSRREREKENMRSAILETAIKIIATEGYEQLSMRKIADAIEYSPTTIYLYYKDKAQIIDDILQEVYKKIISNITTALQENKNAPIDKQVQLSFKAFINTMAQNAEMSRAVIRSGTKAIFDSSSSSASPEESGINMLHNLLLEGQRQGVLRPLDHNASWMLVSALIGFSINAIENRLYKNANWDILADSYIDILLNGIKHEGDMN